VKLPFKKESEKLLSGVSLFGFSKDSLAVFVNSFCLLSSDRVLFVSRKEVFNKSFYRQSRFFNSGLLYYPEPPKGDGVPGFHANHNLIRSQALVGLSKSGGSSCLVSKKALAMPIINKKTELRSLSVSVGDNLDRDSFCKKLYGFGFRAVGCVYSPGEVSVRGDIVDVFPENKKLPLRLSFDFDKLGSLSVFDIDTQRSVGTLSSFVFYDLIGGVVDHGRSLYDFISWDLIVKIKDSGGLFNLVVGPENTKRVVGVNSFHPGKINKQLFKKLILERASQVLYVFYTNKKRKSKIKKVGAVPIRGFIKEPFKTNPGCGVFLPDHKTQKKGTNQTHHKLNKNKPLGVFKVGDVVVHVLHGLGRFCGLFVRGPVGFEKEYIKIEYRAGAVLFVPINKSTLVHKYQGLGGPAKINKLGGRGWATSVSKTKKDIEAVSRSLVGIHNSRIQPRAFTYERPGEIDRAIKKSFPYKETKDQKGAILDVLNDLSKRQPMDRLVCGDVGFGKTEVALRAIVRVASSTKQTVFLCPTTILSDQHYITAKERLTPLGVRVALLSRFQNKKNQKETLLSILSGSVDLIIGTHRLLSEDVVVPRLSLLIVDEEHRFGVKHKEKIRALKNGVDVLSLSATPIPRTLQQSLLGIRDISRIETPPTTRKPICTSVEFFSWRRAAEVIEEELIRGGQVYFLHNRVQSIAYQVEKLRAYFPKENIECVHGQQDSRTLEKNILRFFGGKISVLVCSTIIESGLDVSNANCIIINNPQDLGLSQLYQIRGRVGRGSRQAHCYLFVPKKTRLSETAYRRLKTIERHTSLGSGFSIANQDLEIRGAGAVFGYKQSGQITRVGLEYYNKLLKSAVNKKTNKKNTVGIVDVLFFGKSLLPKHYISEESDRLSFYIKINSAKKDSALLGVKSELLDRFGHLPKETNNFINLAHIRLLYQASGVRVVTINRASVVFELLEKDVNNKIITNVLNYKNNVVLNTRFKESPPALLVFFEVSKGFDWFALAIDCNSLFYVQ